MKSKGEGEMRSRKTFLLIAVALIVLVTTVSAAAEKPTKAPDFNFVDTDGNMQKLDLYDGKVLVIEVMFTTCSVCTKMMPDLVEVYDDAKYYMGEEVAFLSVSVDANDENEDLDNFMDKYGADWPIGVDRSFIETYDAFEVPKIVVISPDGYITFTHKGYIDKEEVLNETFYAWNYEYSVVESVPFLSLTGLIGGSIFISTVIGKRIRI